MNLRLKGRIVERFGSQADFAEAAKTAEGTVSRVVRGRQRLSKRERDRWAKILGCDSESLFEANS